MAATLQVSQHSPEHRFPTEDELAAMPPGLRVGYASALEEAYRRGLTPDGERLARAIGPQSDEELLDAVFELTGHRIPRNAVCVEHGHAAPADTFCDLYFERLRNVLWIGNRGGGKTANSGELHGAKCRWHPNYSSAVAGAAEKQGYRAYAEFKAFTRSLGSEIVDSLLSKTEWVNGSTTEVLGGTKKQLNGPHPHLAQMDEVELTTWDVFEEFLNMAQGDTRYAGQQLLTSTRKKAHGIVQGIVKECVDAERQGEDPPWAVRIFCVFETMARVPNCRGADPEQRRALLESLGRDPGELCGCDRVRKGEWDNGTPRTFESVCGGRAFRADGFVALADVLKRFKQLSRFTWEAQQECLTPNVEGIVHKWLKERHSLATWLPHHQFGPIYRGWDWGGQNPHAVVWCQLLAVPVGLTADGLPVLSDEGEEAVRIIPEGTLIQFDEIHKTSDELPGDGGFSDLAMLVAAREEEWRRFGFLMPIAKDFCDPAGFIAKREVKKTYKQLIASGEHPTLKVPDFKSIPAGVMDSVRLHISWGEGDRILIVESMCPRTSDEYDVYRWPEKKDGRNLKEEPVKEDDHAMDAKRYLIWNLVRMADRAASGEAPAGQERPQPTSEAPGPGGHPFAPPKTVPHESPVGAVGGNTPQRGGYRQQAPAIGRGRIAGGRSFK